ncbi:hypothetical protein HJG60_009674 [Phyllostomus discolor]|uniref:Uncharacterized protein n=1 Tax=Phyllostomus discolor TaxID=89673 RepID=A0A834B9P4_9CHIR|nr:hypothetical protein HJG60_009674 [Phyllostomus discolor]
MLREALGLGQRQGQPGQDPGQLPAHALPPRKAGRFCRILDLFRWSALLWNLLTLWDQTDVSESRESSSLFLGFSVQRGRLSFLPQPESAWGACSLSGLISQISVCMPVRACVIPPFAAWLMGQNGACHGIRAQAHTLCSAKFPREKLKMSSLISIDRDA